MDLDLDIITPTLNSSDFLESCIISTRIAREHGAVHMLSDSYSTDDTLEIAGRHGLTWSSCAPGNMYHAINVGLTQGNNPWCTYLNCDDILFSRSVIDALSKRASDADVIYGDLDYIDDQGRFLHHWKSPPPSEIMPLFKARVMPIPQMGTLFRRQVFEKLNGFNDSFRYSADFDFFLRARIAGYRFARYRYGPLASFRIHPMQFSQNVSLAMHTEGKTALEESAVERKAFAAAVAKTRMRFRNITSYMERGLRFRSLHGYWTIPTTFGSPKRRN